MPGTSQTMEFSILNGSPAKFFNPVRKIVNYYSLAEIVVLMEKGVNDDLQREFPNVSDYEWNELLKKVCLTRLTAIRIEYYYPLKTLCFLQETTKEALNCPHCSYKELMSRVPKNQEALAVWIARLNKYIELKSESAA